MANAHRSGLDAINRDHHARNNDHKLGMKMGASPVGGSMKFTDPGPKGKGSGIPKGNADVKALGKASGGRIESRPGKK